MSAYGSDPLTSRSHAVNHVRKQEHEERKDADKATRKRREGAQPGMGAVGKRRSFSADDPKEHGQR
jgi:hypothetical protein